MKWQRTYTNRDLALRASSTASFPSFPGCRTGGARPAPAAAFLAALSVLLLAGCASAPRTAAGEPSLPEIDVIQLKENSDEALKLAQETKLEVQTLTAKVNELEGRVSALGDEVAGLPLTKLEELTQQVALVSEQLRTLEDRLNKVPAGASGGRKELPTFSPTAIDSANGKTPDLPAPAPGKSATAAKPAEKAPKVQRKPNATDVEAALYKQGFDLFYARDYGKAIDRFEELLKKFPKGTYADNCRYWIGECHFAMGNFAKAVASFNQVLASAESEKADDAQLKLGYCYLRLGERKRAAAEFKKVVSLYPESEYTERAKEELAKLE